MMFPWSPSDRQSAPAMVPVPGNFPGHRTSPRGNAQSSPEEKIWLHRGMSTFQQQDLNQQTIELGAPHLKKKPKAKQTFQVRRSPVAFVGVSSNVLLSTSNNPGLPELEEVNKYSYYQSPCNHHFKSIDQPEVWGIAHGWVCNCTIRDTPYIIYI